MKKTEKLYYIDAYIKEFDARIISVREVEHGYEVILDRTAFFPEEGGQSADTGTIGDARVLDARECDGIIYHLTDTLPQGSTVHCKIDFDTRFEKMQLHTAEHILCGIINRKYGYDNVGFHLGDEECTFDINAYLSREQLDEIEEIANGAVFNNLPVDCFFPSSKELATMSYRSKLENIDNVRIVKIGDVDSCACCAPHVNVTGEIGIIKVLEFMKHRGGTRIWFTAGRRALFDYRKKYENILRISALLSTPQHDSAKTIERYIKDNEQQKRDYKATRLSLAEAYASLELPCEANAVKQLEGFSVEELIAFSNAYKSRVGGVLVALSGTDGDYKYVISSENVDLREVIKDINSSLSGRGGGKPNMMQGSFSATLAQIKEYFE